MVTGSGGGLSLFPSRSYGAASLSKTLTRVSFPKKKRLRQSSSPPQCDQKLICPVRQVASVFSTIATNSSSRRVLAPGLRLRLGALSPKNKTKTKTNKVSFLDIRWPETLKRRLFPEMEASVGVFPSLGANFEVIFSGSPQALSVSRRRAWLRVCGGLRCV